VILYSVQCYALHWTDKYISNASMKRQPMTRLIRCRAFAIEWTSTLADSASPTNSSAAAVVDPTQSSSLRISHSCIAISFVMCAPLEPRRQRARRPDEPSRRVCLRYVRRQVPWEWLSRHRPNRTDRIVGRAVSIYILVSF